MKTAQASSIRADVEQTHWNPILIAAGVCWAWVTFVLESLTVKDSNLYSPINRIGGILCLEQHDAENALKTLKGKTFCDHLKQGQQTSKVIVKKIENNNNMSF